MSIEQNHHQPVLEPPWQLEKSFFGVKFRKMYAGGQSLTTINKEKSFRRRAPSPLHLLPMLGTPQL